MDLIIRFGYCPPSPGPKAGIKNKWYTDINDAIENWDGRSEIWVSYNKGVYRQISYADLLNMVED